MNANIIRSGVGGYFLAIGRLEPDVEAAHQIALLFGIELSNTSTAEPKRASSPPSVPLPPTLESGTAAEEPDEVPLLGDAAGADGRGVHAAGSHSLHVVLRRGPGELPAATMPELPQSHTGTHKRELELEPLLRPLATRAIVSSSLARQDPAGGRIDVDKLVELCAERRSIEQMPRLPRWSTAGRTLLLVDRGVGMTPFARDANHLLERVRAVAGRDRTEIKSFWRTPMRTRTSRAAGAELVVPTRGTAVLALTDLGIAPGAPSGVTADWLEYASMLRDAGSSLVIFVPYPAERWPDAARGLPLVTWDRPTSLAGVLAATRQRSGR